MPLVDARMAVSFSVPSGSPYMKYWDSVAQKSFKDTINLDVLTTVPEKFLNNWRDKHQIQTDAGGHASEAVIRDFIKQRLAEYNQDPLPAWELSLSGTDVEANQVTYTWVGKVRVCHHFYSIDFRSKGSQKDFEPWYSFERPDSSKPTQLVEVMVDVSWPRTTI